MIVSVTDDVQGPQKESGESDEGEQQTALVKAEVCDLSDACYKSGGMTHYSALENQRYVLVRLMTFLEHFKDTLYSLFGEYQNLLWGCGGGGGAVCMRTCAHVFVYGRAWVCAWVCACVRACVRFVR